ncbi:hypothetical protein F4782DRAFT_535999 [Xylaria castorea]|nr:hypothetical protein F4782DRAFT_535999 [Xylaria castorea]
MGFISKLVACLAFGVAVSAASFAARNARKCLSHRLSPAAQGLFNWAMFISNNSYDLGYNYIWYPDNGPMSVRVTSWYVSGLLFRAWGDDVANAIKSIENILDYEPDPTPDSGPYPPLSTVVAEFEHLLLAALIGKIEDAIKDATRNNSNTIGEYNAPNYYGINIWALACNIAYGAADLPTTQNAKVILRELYKDIGRHYNQFLSNMLSFYNRAYSRNITQNS